MARKGKGQETETLVVTRHVKEWQPTHDDPLPQIHATIDSWGRGGAAHAGLDESARDLDPAYVTAQVDKITKRVKPTQKVTITETVTEWVEGPPGSGPIAVEQEPPTAWSDKDAKPKEKPAKAKGDGKGLFGLFGRKKDKGAAAATTPDKEYQPQCMALTDDGAQCRNSARGDSKYCASHKGYQPPTAKGLAQRIEGDAWDPDDHVTDHESVRSKDTRPAVRHAPDTRLRTRKAAKKKAKARKKR